MVFPTNTRCFCYCCLDIIEVAEFMLYLSPDGGVSDCLSELVGIMAYAPPFLSRLESGDIPRPSSPDAASLARILMIFLKSSFISPNHPVQRGVTWPL